MTSFFIYSAVVDYVKWQLLVNEVGLYTASLSQDTWRILQEIKFPKTSKLGQDINLNCVELVENIMPLAVARPFVEEFITDTARADVSLCSYMGIQLAIYACKLKINKISIFLLIPTSAICLPK